MYTVRAVRSLFSSSVYKLKHKHKHSTSAPQEFQMILSDGHLGAGSKLPPIPDDGKLLLYSMQFCPFAQRIHLVLDAKKIPYNTIFVNLSQKPEWFKEKSPMGKVPALQIAELKLPLIESLAIAEYLDERYPSIKLNKVDFLGRTYDRIVIERFQKVITSLYALLLADDKGPAYDKLMRNLEFFETELGDRGSPYFGGNKPGMVDYMIWPWFERMEIVMSFGTNRDEKKISKLIQWCNLMKNDEAVKCSIISTEHHIKFMEGRKNKNIEYDVLLKPKKGSEMKAKL